MTRCRALPNDAPASGMGVCGAWCRRRVKACVGRLRELEQVSRDKELDRITQHYMERAAQPELRASVSFLFSIYIAIENKTPTHHPLLSALLVFIYFCFFPFSVLYFLSSESGSAFAHRKIILALTCFFGPNLNPSCLFLRGAFRVS